LAPAIETRTSSPRPIGAAGGLDVGGRVALDDRRGRPSRSDSSIAFGSRPASAFTSAS
jgi:hypothetical protein